MERSGYVKGAALAATLLLEGCASASVAQSAADQAVVSDQARFRVATVVTGLEHPWGVAFLPNGDMLVTERPGRLRLVQNGQLLPEPIAGTPEVFADGQGGLLDVAIDPDFAANQQIYLSYAAEQNGATTRVMRAQFAPDGLSAQSVIFEALPRGRSGVHFGSRLAFGRDGMLYVTVGERGDRPRAQNLGAHGGSVIRLRPDGTVPPDNPFVGREGVRPEIFSNGHRNPQGLAIEPATGRVWAHEHGPQGGDEVNLIEAGVNYGWPVITFGRAYSGGAIGKGTAKPGMAQPLWYWVPSIAPSGMAFYDGDAFPEWRGDLFVGALKARLLVRLEIEDGQITGEERMLQGELGRIRDVRAGPDGLIYLLTDEGDGGLYRLEPVD